MTAYHDDLLNTRARAAFAGQLPDAIAAFTAAPVPWYVRAFFAFRRFVSRITGR
jgi:hypothetical protein